MSTGTDGYDRALHAERDRLKAALEAILEDAVYTARHETISEDLRGYLQTVRGHARGALREKECVCGRPVSVCMGETPECPPRSKP